MAEYEYGQDSGSKALFCDPERLAMAKEACDKLGVKVVLARGDAAPERGALLSVSRVSGVRWTVPEGDG